MVLCREALDGDAMDGSLQALRETGSASTCVGRDRAVGHRADRRQNIAVTGIDMSGRRPLIKGYFPLHVEPIVPDYLPTIITDH
jgi:hypothetical protein